MKIINGKRFTTVMRCGLFGFFGDYAFLSNFEPSPFKLTGEMSDGLTYATSEHGYMALKSNDISVRKMIAELATPRQARDAGQLIEMREDWDLYKPNAMLAVVREKFQQNHLLAQKLLSTGLLYLEETNNWGDTYWGVVDGFGLNMLGKTLMQVRAELQRNPGLVGARL